MRFLIIFIFFISNTFASEVPDIKNIIIHKEPKKYDGLLFLDEKNDELNLQNLKGKLILLNFWATWCTPCKEEMPSLDRLITHKNLDNLKIFPINIGNDSFEKSQKFYKELKIKNLNFYFDNPVTLAKKLSLQGIPTSVLFDKNGKEFARIIGSIDFEDERFIQWLASFN